jgi:hypothetical protein
MGFDFELAMKVIVALGTGGLVLLTLGVGVKFLFFRKPRLPSPADPEQLEGLEERLQHSEAKIAELEERLDFTERMLLEVRNRAQLPGS